MLGPWGYSRRGMTTALGLLAFCVYIVAVVAVAAGVTWVVVKLSPAKQPDSTPKT